MDKEKSKVEVSKEIEPWDDFNEVDLSKKRYVSDETRNRQSEVQNRLWNDPTERSKRLERIRSKDVRERISNTLKDNWKNDPEHRERQTNHLTKIAKTTWDRKLQERGKTILSEFREVHGDRYDYSKVDFQGMTKKVTIICPDHGEFQTIPSSHLKGVNCQTCSRLVTSRKKSQLRKGKSPPNKRTTEQLVQQFIEVHGDRYDYSKVEFVGQNVPVIVICRKHGEFKIREYFHRKGGHCPKCPERQVSSQRGQVKTSTEKIIQGFRKKHQDRFDYSKVEFRGTHNEVVVICREHGEFLTTAHKHRNQVSGNCPDCKTSL